ncbi:MAG: ComEC/Rec2 family competence protein [Butyrivibrio sp.]|nr:ComEC/Rec2 family competence protein [Butyrivibrio sp.]
MKRPLCHLAILLTAVVYLYLEFFSSGFFYDVPADKNGAYVTLTGKVWSKTFKPGFDGKLFPVIDIIPTKKSKSSFELVECFFEAEEAELPSIGEYVEVSGKLKVFEPPTNPGEFDSRLYYSTLKISYRITGARMSARGGKKNAYRETLFEIRMQLERALDSVLDKGDSSVMKAMLLGDKAYMEDEIKDMYRSSGIMHILAVSGLHISIIGMGLYRMIRKLTGKMSDVMERYFPVRSSGTTKVSYTLLTLFDRVLPVAVSVVFMYSYGVMCRMGTSSFRAIMMFALRLFAPVFGRTYDILSALSLSEILLVLDQPLYLYNSGFLFSFGAVVGIAVIYPCLKSAVGVGKSSRMKFADDRIPITAAFLNKLLDGVLSGLSIAIATLPVYAAFIYAYPVQSILLNLLVIPVMGILMLLGIIAMLLGAASMLLSELLWPGIFSHITESSGGLPEILTLPATDAFFIPGRLSGFAVHIILEFYKWLCSFEGMTRHLTWYMGHSSGWQIVLYTMLICAFVFISEPSEHKEGRRKVKLPGLDAPWQKGVLRGIIPAAAILVLTFHVNPDLEIDMIDVGQGDAIVVRCGPKSMLIDGGSTTRKKVGRYQIIPFLKYNGIGELETVVITHEDEDHISGIFEVLDDMEKGGITVRSMLLPEIDNKSKGDNYKQLEKRSKELGIPISYINSGERFSLGDADFFCMNPRKGMYTEGANEYSTVLYMEYVNNTPGLWNSPKREEPGSGTRRTFTALFTGDVEGQGQTYLVEELRRLRHTANDTSDILKDESGIDLLKVAHHGSRYTTDEEFLRLLHPAAAVISCGRDNTYGHPHEEVLERLNNMGSDIYRTDMDGCIRICFNGKNAQFYHFFISKYIQFGS